MKKLYTYMKFENGEWKRMAHFRDSLDNDYHKEV